MTCAAFPSFSRERTPEQPSPRQQANVTSQRAAFIALERQMCREKYTVSGLIHLPQHSLAKSFGVKRSLNV
jgi:hypothetical protein